jgi:hypothetical protein
MPCYKCGERVCVCDVPEVHENIWDAVQYIAAWVMVFGLVGTIVGLVICALFNS